MESVLLLQAVSGMIYMLTITAVALRLLMLSRRTRELPELLLGLSLLIGGTFGASFEAGALAAKLEIEPALVGTLLLSGKVCGLAALLFQSTFIWKVFRPDAAWAPVLIGTYFSISLLAFAGFWVHGTFTTAEIPMTWFWLELIGRTAGSVWLVCEGVRYYTLMRRRRAIGLGDPVITNRFLLWAIAGTCGISMMLTAVPPVLDPTSTHPLMAFDLVAFSAFGIGFCIVYTLVFFPPAAYERWIAGRATAGAS